METVRARALGAVLGAFCGDAAGAVLEFYPRDIRTKDVEWALTFSGGGVFKVAPGQITDDSEMAMCLLHALADSGANTLNAKLLMKNYVKWFCSEPFDMGMTT